jgi:hypothetical protein
MIEYRFVRSTHALAVLRARKRRRRDLGDRRHLDELRGEVHLNRIQYEVTFAALAGTGGSAEEVNVCSLCFS